MFSLSTACLTFSPFLSSLQQLVGSYPSVSTISSSFPSYYASKICTYTDAAGRPVPAPRNAHPERPASVATVPGSSQFILPLMVLTTRLSPGSTGNRDSSLGRSSDSLQPPGETTRCRTRSDHKTFPEGTRRSGLKPPLELQERCLVGDIYIHFRPSDYS